jgi:TPR repeat protein
MAALAADLGVVQTSEASAIVTSDIADLRARAEAGSTPAQAVLGIRLLRGIDCQLDYREAFRWLSAASEKGAPRAMAHLGSMYEQGLAVTTDWRRARELYERAAARGEFLACVWLARLLARSEAGAADQEGALRWYRAALSQADVVGEAAELEEARSYVEAHSKE